MACGQGPGSVVKGHGEVFDGPTPSQTVQFGFATDIRFSETSADA
jgi:hypothetical protein